MNIWDEAETAIGPFDFDDYSDRIRLRVVHRFYPRTAEGVAEQGIKVRNVVGRCGDKRSNVCRSGGVKELCWQPRSRLQKCQTEGRNTGGVRI
jgi:hypothetical protein